MLVRALRRWGALLLIFSLACPATMADAATPKTTRTKAKSTSAAPSRSGSSTAPEMTNRGVRASTGCRLRSRRLRVAPTVSRSLTAFW